MEASRASVGDAVDTQQQVGATCTRGSAAFEDALISARAPGSRGCLSRHTFRLQCFPTRVWGPAAQRPLSRGADVADPPP